jgi:repressor LexA
MLTKKQSELLMFINERLKESGVSPSFDEMKEALNLRSKSGIHRLITALEERGFIQTPTASRPCAGCGETTRKYAVELIGRFKPQRHCPTDSRPMMTSSVSIAVMGRIAAGTPIEALQEEVNQISIPIGNDAVWRTLRPRS